MLEISKLFYYHNKARQEVGIKPLKNSYRLNNQCRDYARKMSSSGNLKHSTSMSKDIKEIFPECMYWGENIGVTAPPRIARKLQAAFMASLDHRDNILDHRFTHCGMGFYKDSSGQIWACVRFVKI